MNAFQELLEQQPSPATSTGPDRSACRTLAVRLSWTGDVYAAADRPNLDEPDKAAALYEQALRIQERLAALDANDRQAHFDLAARYGKLGDAMWRPDPKRALDLYDASARDGETLASKEQFEILRGFVSSSRSAGRSSSWTDGRSAQGTDRGPRDGKTDSRIRRTPIGSATSRVRGHLAELLLAEGKPRRLDGRWTRSFATPSRCAPAIRKISRRSTFSPTAIALLASITTGQERREALLHSAAAWHSWPATSFTRREEQKDLAAANR